MSSSTKMLETMNQSLIDHEREITISKSDINCCETGIILCYQPDLLKMDASNKGRRSYGKKYKCGEENVAFFGKPVEINEDKKIHHWGLEFGRELVNPYTAHILTEIERFYFPDMTNCHAIIVRSPESNNCIALHVPPLVIDNMYNFMAKQIKSTFPSSAHLEFIAIDHSPRENFDKNRLSRCLHQQGVSNAISIRTVGPNETGLNKSQYGSSCDFVYQLDNGKITLQQGPRTATHDTNYQPPVQSMPPSITMTESIGSSMRASSDDEMDARYAQQVIPDLEKTLESQKELINSKIQDWEENHRFHFGRVCHKKAVLDEVKLILDQYPSETTISTSQLDTAKIQNPKYNKVTTKGKSDVVGILIMLDEFLETHQNYVKQKNILTSTQAVESTEERSSTLSSG